MWGEAHRSLAWSSGHYGVPRVDQVPHLATSVRIQLVLISQKNPKSQWLQQGRGLFSFHTEDA